MLQKLPLQLVISMHFQSFIGKLIILIKYFFHILHDYQLILRFLKEMPQDLLQTWLGGLGINLTLMCSLFKRGVIFIVFGTAIYFAIMIVPTWNAIRGSYLQLYRMPEIYSGFST